MPKLTREEAQALVGVRRMLALLANCLPKPSAEGEPAGITLILKELKLMSDTFDTEMTKLRADVAAQSTVIASATQAFRGLAAQLVAAEAAAKNAGATDAQVAGVTTLRQQLEANTNSLAAAIPANTDTGNAAAPGTTDPVTTTPVTTTPVTTTPVTTAPATDTAPAVTSSVAATAPAAPSTPLDTAITIVADAAVLAANQAR